MAVCEKDAQGQQPHRQESIKHRAGEHKAQRWLRAEDRGTEKAEEGSGGR